MYKRGKTSNHLTSVRKNPVKLDRCVSTRRKCNTNVKEAMNNAHGI